MYVLDLCSGVGGFSLALKWLVGGFETICYVEIDPYCQGIIRQRIEDGYLDDAPIWSDLKTFDGAPWRGSVDLITAGFPCQPFSVAGKRKGEADERNLWPDVWRTIHQVRPRYVLLENVPGLLTNPYIGRIFGDLAESGYDTRWDCIPASSVGANHQRDRLWIYAYRESESAMPINAEMAELSNVAHTSIDLRGTPRDEIGDTPNRASAIPITPWRGTPYVLADAERGRRGREICQMQEHGSAIQAEGPTCDAVVKIDWWSVEPSVGRVAHGIPKRVDRLKALGNAVVPAVVAKAWEALKE